MNHILAQTELEKQHFPEDSDARLKLDRSREFFTLKNKLLDGVKKREIKTMLEVAKRIPELEDSVKLISEELKAAPVGEFTDRFQKIEAKINFKKKVLAHMAKNGWLITKLGALTVVVGLYGMVREATGSSALEVREGTPVEAIFGVSYSNPVALKIKMKNNCNFSKLKALQENVNRLID